MSDYIRRALLTYLRDHPDLYPLLNGRVYHLRAPQNVARPYLVFSRPNNQNLQSLRGSSGLARARFQFDIWGDDPEDLEPIEKAVRQALQGRRLEVDGVKFGGGNHENDLEDFDEQTQLYLMSTDFVIWSKQEQHIGV